MTIDRRSDRLGYGVRPDSQSTLQEWTRLGQVSTGRLRRILDDPGQTWSEVELTGEDIDVNVQRTEDALHRGIADEDRVVPTVAEGQARGCQRRQVAAGASRRHDQDP
jgi:hypothetical protein